MKRKIAKVLISAGLIAFTISCGEDEIMADAKGDVFILSKTEGVGEDAVTVYGVALHAFGTVSFSKVTATLPGSMTASLASYNGSAYEYYYETDRTAFTETLPEAGNYTFDFTFITGETGTDTDVLTEDVIEPAVITNCEYNVAESKVEITWDKPDEADFFVIYMENSDGEFIYVSEALAGTKVSHEISSGTSYWYGTPDNGATYTVIVGAFRYETAKVDLNIQAKSMAASTVVWGGNE